MKKILMMALLLTGLYGTGFAQTKSIVGKWKFAQVSSNGVTFDLEHPETIRKTLADEMAKQTGGPADTAQVNKTYDMLVGALSGIVMEFNASGTGLVSHTDPGGKRSSDSLSYIADYPNNVLTTFERKDGSDKKTDLDMKFEGDYLTLTDKEKGEVVKLRRIR